MNDSDKLSQILDEFSDQDSDLTVLDEVLSDVNLQYQMRRYQIIGDVMRHELPEKIDTEFSQSVMNLILDEGSDAARSTRAKPAANTSFWQKAFLRPVAGVALAASVAIVSVTLWQTTRPGALSEQPDEMTASVNQKKIDDLIRKPIVNTAVPVSSQLTRGMRWKASNENPELQQKLNAYLVNHTEYSNSMQGLIPQARVAGFDSQQ